MLSISRKAEYALVALWHLAKHPEAISSAREIAIRYRIPHPVLMNILKRLTREGLVCSVRGAAGGYRLVEPPEHLSLLRVIEALEGPVRLVLCADGDDASCELATCCPIRRPATVLDRRLKEFLAGVTLASLLEDLPVGLPVQMTVLGGVGAGLCTTQSVRPVFSVSS